MKKIISIIFFIIISINMNLYSQSLQVRLAIRKGRTSDFYYQVNFTNKLLTPEQLKKWQNKNSSKYYLISYETKDEWFAGKKRRLVSSFCFIKADELSEYEEFQIKQLEERARRARIKAQRDQANFQFLANTFSLTTKILEEAVKIMPPEDNNYSINENEDNNTTSNNNTIVLKIVSFNLDKSNYCNGSCDRYIITFNQNVNGPNEWDLKKSQIYVYKKHNGEWHSSSSLIGSYIAHDKNKVKDWAVNKYK